eukprot:gene9766-10765_t
MPIPKSVTVLVYAGKGLKPKKGDGPPHAWVVFGFGKNKCCTAQASDVNPKWNEENNFTITDPKAPLKLTVKDKDDTLGQIQIPLTDIPHDEHTFKWIPLGPHRRNLNPSGEICIDCWIVDYSDSDTPKKDSNFLKLKHKLHLKPPIIDGKRKGSLKTGAISMKGSISVEDLSRAQNKPSNLSKLPENQFCISSGISKATSVYFSKPDASPPLSKSPSPLSVTKEIEKPAVPEIKMLTPISGPSTGGTLIRITGKNLGRNKNDIIALTVAGIDCLSTLEYHSSGSLMCTTSAGQGVGPIFLNTESGGSCTSKLQFEFEIVDEDNSADDAFQNVSPVQKKPPLINLGKKPLNGRRLSLHSKLQEKKSSSQDLKREVDELTNEVKELRTENSELKRYLDSLLLYIMEKYPEALESSRFHR